MAEKSMSFEEWWEQDTDFEDDKLMCQSCWDAARIGMIPADRAVEIPEKWQDGAKGIVVLWSHLEDPVEWNQQEHTTVIKYIPHPAPAWTPKVGDRVFVSRGEFPGRVDVGVFESDSYGYKIRFGGWAISFFPDIRMKPFDPAKIGLPWGEI